MKIVWMVNAVAKSDRMVDPDRIGFIRIAMGDPSEHTASGCRSTCHRTALVLGGWKPGRAKVARPCFTTVSHWRLTTLQIGMCRTGQERTTVRNHELL